jgi:hypothetical protein
MHTGYWWGSQKEGDHSEDQDVGGWTILNRSYRDKMDGVDWVDLAQNRDQWGALVNTVMNLRVR